MQYIVLNKTCCKQLVCLCEPHYMLVLSRPQRVRKLPKLSVCSCQLFDLFPRGHDGGAAPIQQCALERASPAAGADERPCRLRHFWRLAYRSAGIQIQISRSCRPKHLPTQIPVSYGDAIGKVKRTDRRKKYGESSPVPHSNLVHNHSGTRHVHPT